MKPILHLCFAILSAVLISGCALFVPPADLDVRQARPSENALYLVTVRPLEGTPKINQIHAWEIGVTTSSGVPVADADIAFGGGMPQHFHGYPTKPRVTAYLGEGKYRLDGVKFSMSGWWNMKLAIQSRHGSDQVVFNTIVSTAVPSVPLGGR